MAQLLVNAIALGAGYALAALGFVLVLNATKAVNFAHGDLVMAGGFAAVALTPLAAGSGVPGLLLLPLVMAAMAAIGIVLSALAYWPLRHRPVVSIFVSTIAAGIILQQGANSLFGAASQAAPPLVSGSTFEVAGLALSRQSLAVIAAALVLTGGLHALLTRTQFGRRMRAAAADPEMARCLGISVKVMTLAAFAMAGALAGAAGLLLGNQYFVEPTSGLNFMLKAYIATVIGGWGNLWGAAAAALLIAVFELFVGSAVSTSVAEAALFVFLLAMLLVRPQGLFGEAAGERA